MQALIHSEASSLFCLFTVLINNLDLSRKCLAPVIAHS